MAYDYSHADWDGLHDHLGDVPWEDIFKLSASAAASEFCGWVQVGIDVYIYIIYILPVQLKPGAPISWPIIDFVPCLVQPLCLPQPLP